MAAFTSSALEELRRPPVPAKRQAFKDRAWLFPIENVNLDFEKPNIVLS